MSTSSVSVKLVILAALAVAVAAAILVNARRPPPGPDAAASEQSAGVQDRADGSSNPEAAAEGAVNAKVGSSGAGLEPRPAYAALGQTAPKLAGQEWVRGEPTSLDDLKGKVVLLDIFQIICPGCHRAHPEIVRMRKRYAERGFEVLGLAVAFELESIQTPAHIRAYVKREKYPYPVAIDQALMDTFRRYRSRGTPFSVLIDRRGRIRYLDFFRLGRVESLVKRLLDEEA